jgi:hypothetical protein
LGTLLLAGRPMTVTEIVETLHAHGVTTSPVLTRSPSRVIADLLAYQVRAGRVRKVARATFALVPGATSASTRSRWRHWRDALVDDVARR